VLVYTLSVILNREKMKAKTVFMGILIAIILPVFMAYVGSICLHNNLWIPNIKSHGILYSPAIYFQENRSKTNHWEVIVLGQTQNHEELFKKWQTLPQFFINASLIISTLGPSSLSDDLQKDLSKYNKEFLYHDGSLLVIDPQGYIAMGFDHDVPVQDVFFDLKKILPKHSVKDRKGLK